MLTSLSYKHWRKLAHRLKAGLYEIEDLQLALALKFSHGPNLQSTKVTQIFIELLLEAVHRNILGRIQPKPLGYDPATILFDFSQTSIFLNLRYFLVKPRVLKMVNTGWLQHIFLKEKNSIVHFPLLRNCNSLNRYKENPSNHNCPLQWLSCECCSIYTNPHKVCRKRSQARAWPYMLAKHCRMHYTTVRQIGQTLWPRDRLLSACRLQWISVSGFKDYQGVGILELQVPFI